MNALLESALAIAATGWRVIPLHTPIDGACDCRRPDCSSPGKHPRTKNGLSDATTDADQIRRWWGMWPGANIGAVVPDDYVVVDVDVADLASAFAADELPHTATSRTGRGWHYVYRAQVPLRPKVGVREHVDLRGPGSYVVVPPSLHASGVRYEWVVPTEDGIADAPAWVADAARSPRTAGDRPDESDTIPEGKRNATLTSLAGTMRRRGMTAAEIEAGLLAVNAGRCQPPLPEDAVWGIASSVGRYPPGSGRATPPRPAADAADAGVPAGGDDHDAPESESGDLGPTSPESADPAGNGEEPAPLPPPSEPMRVANRLVAERFGGPADGLILRYWRGEFWRWQTSHWLEVADSALRAECYRYTEHAVFEKMRNGVTTLEPWAPNRYRIADLVDALRAVTHLTATNDMPAWLDDRDHPPASELVSCANGLLDIPTRTLISHDNAYFNQVAVPFDYQADPPAPTGWLTFLDELWPDDPEAIETLAEFMGYVISGRRDLHKILLLIGPTRAGKGVIARVLKALVGRGNYAGPTLASLGTNFGLSPLIGKPLAIVSDARLGGANVHQVVERLLSVSGEDMLTVDRKYKEPWTGTLPTRFLVISNELPRFGDASGAIAGRFLVLTLRQSWLGRENPALTGELLTELPGILSWVLDGLERLNARGRFTEPASSTDAIVALADLVSPTSAFVCERCEVDPGSQVPCDELYGAWKSWAEDNGHRVGSSSSFGRDLRAVLPGLRTVRPRDDDRQRLYRGLRLSGDHNGPVHGPSWTRPLPAPTEPPVRPLVQDGPGDQPLWSAGDEPSSTVRCDHYHDHQSVHRWVGDRWVCPACNPDGAAREPESPALKNTALRESPDLGDWFEAPLPAPEEAATDEWGTIG